LQIDDPVPTDNDRVFTTKRCSISFNHSQIRFADDGNTIEADYRGTWYPVPKELATELLSVVRTLHAELDRMADPSGPDLLQMPSPRKIPQGNVLASANNSFKIDQKILPLNAGQFIGGKITLLRADDTAIVDRNAFDPFNAWPPPVEGTLPTMEEMIFSEAALRKIVQNRSFVKLELGF